MKIVLIIPTYNEKENIRRTVSAIQSEFKRLNNDDEGHILITDANSPDGTADEVRRMIKEFPNIHLIAEKSKNGLGAAYKGAMNYAFYTMNADAIITFDADLSHDPTKINDFINEIRNGADYVCGTRYRKGGGIPPEWGIHRKLLSYLGNFFVRILYLGSGMSDFTSGYKAMNKKVYDKISEDIGRHGGYTFAIAANLEPIRKGFKIVEVPYQFKDRTLGKSKMGSEYIFNAFIFVVRARFVDIINSRFGKVFIAGGVGSVSQFVTFGFLFRPFIEERNIFSIPYEYLIFGYQINPAALLALFLAIEVGVLTTFTTNNLWAFKDFSLDGLMFWRRFVKNQFVVAGAIVIQLGIFQGLANIFGRGFLIDYMYQIVGILVGLIWNFYFYKKIIWKINPKSELDLND